jgi:hypothetical protein
MEEALKKAEERELSLERRCEAAEVRIWVIRYRKVDARS